MTAKREEKLRTTQWRMIRWMIGVGRRMREAAEEITKEEEEDWVDKGSEEKGEEEEPGSVVEECKMEEGSWMEWIRRATRIAEHHLEKGKGGGPGGVEQNNKIEVGRTRCQKNRWKVVHQSISMEARRWTQAGWATLGKMER